MIMIPPSSPSTQTHQSLQNTPPPERSEIVEDSQSTQATQCPELPQDPQRPERPSFPAAMAISPSHSALPRSPQGSPLPLATLLFSTLVVGLAGGWILAKGVPERWIPVAFAAQTSQVSQVTSPTETAQASAAIQVQAILARLQPIPADRTLTGTLEAVESVSLTSRIPGRISVLGVKEGDRVQQGQVIARIDVSDIEAQRQQAEAQIQQAEAAMRVAEAGADTARAARIEAEARLGEAEAELTQGQLDQSRLQTLYDEGAVSQSALDQANTYVTTIESRIQQIQAGIHRAEAVIVQAEAQVLQAQAGIQQAQAIVNQATANLTYGVVEAPFTGVITHKYAEVGAIAGQGQPLVELENTDHIRFTTAVPEATIGDIRLGQPVQVFVDALDRTISGQISQIIPSGDPVARSFTVKVALEPTPEAIPGLFGRWQIQTQDRSALLIPETALVERLGVTGIFTVIEGKAHFKPVVLGATYTDQAEIFSGLEAGETVILNPDPSWTEGTPVRIS